MRAVSCLAAIAAMLASFAIPTSSLTVNKVHSAAPLAKRLTFHPGGREDYCSETNPTITYGDGTPLAVDCAAIGQAVDGLQGFWTVKAQDFDAADRWATIASSGTCRFALRFQVASTTQDMLIGTSDVQFYINNYIGNEKDRHIQAVGAAACNNNTDGVLLFMEWGMIPV